MPEISEQTWNLILSYSLRVAGVLAILLAAWLLARFARRVITRSLEKANLDRTLTRFAAGAARILILVLAALACLSLFGIETTSFSAIIAAAGLAVGLALQGTLANFAAGVMLLVFRPFRVDDEVTVAGATGMVEEIELFSTLLRTPDNRLVVVPNKNIFGATIEIATHFPTRRLDFTLAFDAAFSVDATRGLLEERQHRVAGAGVVRHGAASERARGCRADAQEHPGARDRRPHRAGGRAGRARGGRRRSRRGAMIDALRGPWGRVGRPASTGAPPRRPDRRNSGSRAPDGTARAPSKGARGGRRASRA